MRTLCFSLLLALLSGTLLGQSTFTSVQNGDWDDGATWGNTSPGIAGTDFPARADDVIINHTVSVNATNDNGVAGATADGLGLANVGTFNGSGSANFYQTGNITINASGTFSSSVRVMIAGTVEIDGGFSTGGGDDIINIGVLNINSGASFSCGDDFVLSGNSLTNINIAALSSDDLYLDHTDALLCGTGAMTLGDEVQLFNSAATATQICSGYTITCSDGDCGLGTGGTVSGGGGFTLPIELLDFQAQLVAEEGVWLFWTTAAEINNDYFTVERSADGEHWESVMTQPGAGTSSEVLDYEALDANPLVSISYYRLKQTDFDGQYSYSSTVRVAAEETNELSVHPNPTNSTVFLSGQNSNGLLRVFDLAGRDVSSKVSREFQSNGFSLNVSELRAGWYTVQLDAMQVKLLKL